ncbi:hypothetical protein BX600DRAFT_529992 [Xylariales sp. PMI_506]|nr:hypothetical protein BX600DRAFT_529992 [Xylariales sp. PMI_506]
MARWIWQRHRALKLVWETNFRGGLSCVQMLIIDWVELLHKVNGFSCAELLVIPHFGAAETLAQLLAQNALFPGICLEGVLIFTGLLAWGVPTICAGEPLLPIDGRDISDAILQPREVEERQATITYTTFGCVTASPYLDCISSVSTAIPCPLTLPGAAALSCACSQVSAELTCASSFCSVPLVFDIYSANMGGCSHVATTAEGASPTTTVDAAATTTATDATTAQAGSTATTASIPSATTKSNLGMANFPPASMMTLLFSLATLVVAVL